MRIDQEGNFQPVVDFKAPFGFLRFSPVDGSKIAYAMFGTDRKLWTYDLDRATPNPLTDDGIALSFVWMPDGKSLVVGWLKSGVPNLYSLPVDGSSPMEQLTTSENTQFPGSCSPDGKTLAFVEYHPDTGADILLLDMESHEVTPFLNSKEFEGWPEISPDGRWMAYASNESGQIEVWARPFPGPGGRIPISNEGGSRPIWSKDGSKLFFRESDRVWVVDIRMDNGFSPGKPQLLFEKQGFSWTSPVRSWDLWPDGQGFLMGTWAEYEFQPVTEMILVQNWFEELKRLVPMGK